MPIMNCGSMTHSFTNDPLDCFVCVGDERSNWFVFSFLIKLFVPLEQGQNCRSSEKLCSKKELENKTII